MFLKSQRNVSSKKQQGFQSILLLQKKSLTTPQGWWGLHSRSTTFLFPVWCLETWMEPMSRSLSQNDPCWKYHHIPNDRTHPLHPVVRPAGVLHIQQDPVEGPGEGQVHGGVMGGVTLQRHILPLVDVGIGRSQRDLSGICKNRTGWRWKKTTDYLRIQK